MKISESKSKINDLENEIVVLKGRIRLFHKILPILELAIFIVITCTLSVITFW
jgi:hypothetical protein